MEVIMKTLKIALILAMVSFAIMGYAHDVNPPQQDNQIIPLKVLLNKQYYVHALLTQVNPAYILNEDRGIKITVKIRVFNKVYEVVAPYSEWKEFFNTRQILPYFKTKSKEGHKSS